jgi:hypothetical protein
MILKQGDRVLIVHRRLFDGDSGRFFLAVVDAYEQGLARVTGYTFVREQLEGRVLRKEDCRTKIVSVASGSLIVYQLPDDLVIEDVQVVIRESCLSMTDGRQFDMNLSEHAYSG